MNIPGQFPGHYTLKYGEARVRSLTHLLASICITLFLFVGITSHELPLYAQTAASKQLTVTEPKEVGLSSERLQHLTRVINHNIEENLLAGSVVLIARKGKIAYLNATGMQDIDDGIPMKENTIFRIASMTKPITSVAVMMLYEEGYFRLADPVKKYIPAFNDVRVLAGSTKTSNGTGELSTVPVKRPIKIRDLLTHTSGIVYQWNKKLGKTYAEHGISSGLVEDTNSLAEDIPKLAELPLLHQPGEKWTYGMSVDVLGYLVEVVSGMPLDEFFRQRIFKPLNMDNTQFYVTPEQESRLATAYTVGPNGGLQEIGQQRIKEAPAHEYSATYPTSKSHHFLSGGAGLTSTITDYYRFAQMLLNEGELDGERLLSPKSVKLMTTDHVGDLLDWGGFGLGFRVTRSLAENGELGTVGTYGWGSFWYGNFFIDPKEEMIGICLAQKHPAGGATLIQKYDILARQAIVE